MDEAITKLFRLDEQIAPIVTVNIDFNRKLNIVDCAVAYQNDNTSNRIETTVDFGKIRAENDQRQVIAHSAFEPEGPEAVQFKRSTARDKLAKSDPRWTKQMFEQHYETLQKLEGDLKKMISEIIPDRIDWPSIPARQSGLPAYLVPFSDGGFLQRISTTGGPVSTGGQ